MRTLTSNIALELGYAAGRHREALFATGIVLFVIIMILNLSATLVTRRGGKPFQKNEETRPQNSPLATIVILAKRRISYFQKLEILHSFRMTEKRVLQEAPMYKTKMV